MGKQEREWGFMVETRKGGTRWVRYDYYLNDWKNYHRRYVQPKIEMMQQNG